MNSPCRIEPANVQTSPSLSSIQGRRGLGRGGAFLPNVSAPAQRSRSALARQRAPLAYELLNNCVLCAHECGVNRLAGEKGLCHAGGNARFFCAQVEVSDELELIPSFAVAFSGCDIRCDFCITGASSWNPRAGTQFDPLGMAERIRSALERGARSVMILGGEPTIHLPTVLELVALLPDSARLVWKTNAHGSETARQLLDGIFDVWLADFKFGNDACSQRLAKVPNYVDTVRQNLIWAHNHSELIVRHLLMPGHLECCWLPVASWLANELPGVKVNLRTGFWPAWKAVRHTELRSTVLADESRRALKLARSLPLNLVP